MVTEATLEALLAFRRERDWEQFHTPRNLAVAISVEAGELLEQFQWVGPPDEASAVAANRGAIEHEIADLAIYLTYLAHDLRVDLEACIVNKLALNRSRYPVDKSRGVATKHDRLDHD